MDVPVIKTFVYENQFYFYDTYLNKVIRVSYEQFTEICELMKIGLAEYMQLNKDTNSYNDIIKLIHKGYLKSNFIKKIEHPATNNVDKIINRGVNFLILQTTQQCNFKCRYCLYTRDNNINRTHNNIEMSWNVAKKSVDFLFDHSKDAKLVKISFYGGEPLLNFELIKKVVEYAENRFVTKNIDFQMTNNGSLINKDVAIFLIEHNFHIMISLDGPPNIQNKHRKFYENGNDTYDIVKHNIDIVRELSETYFKNNVSFNPVLMKDEPYQMVLDYFTNLGVEKEKVHCSYAHMAGIDYIEGNMRRDLVDSNYSDFTNYMNREYIASAKMVMNKHSSIPEMWHPNGPCIPSINRLFIDVHGNLYPCEKVLETSCATIGNIYDGFNIERVKQMMNIGKITEEDCKQCWAMRFCDICVSKCIDFENNCYSSDLKKLLCKEVRDSARDYIRECIIKK